jgi:DNA-3-methyladenine glycosylase
MITETEAYRGADDPASHAFKGATSRSRIMFGPPGISYVYLIYGMYHCLNIVTEDEGDPGAVLIRGLKLITSPNLSLQGPGKLCKHLGITKRSHHGIDIIEDSHFFITESTHSNDTFRIVSSPRIGISRALNLPWRFSKDV